MMVRRDVMMIWLPIIIVLMVLFALAWRNQPARNPEKKSPDQKALVPKQRRIK